MSRLTMGYSSSNFDATGFVLAAVASKRGGHGLCSGKLYPFRSPNRSRTN